jgi:hypothetical protein
MGKHSKKQGMPVAQVEGITVRKIDKDEKVKLDNGKSITQTKSTDFVLMHGKKEIEKGFKNKPAALARAKELNAAKKK